MNQPVIPFKNEGIFVLHEIKKRILENRDSVDLGRQKWAEIYSNTYNEVLSYVSKGVIPRGGFSLGIGAFGSIFHQPVLEAHRYRVAMPVGTLEAFYAICTSSAHVSELHRYDL